MEGLIIDLIKNNLDDRQVVLFCHYYNDTPFDYSINIRLNGYLSDENIRIQKGFWFYRFYHINGDSISIEIFRNGVLDEIKTYNLTESIFDYINESGIIVFK